MPSSPSGHTYKDDPGPIRERIAYKQQLFQWCLRNAASCARRALLEEATVWNDLAARVLSNSCAPLVSQELERNLLAIARRLPVPEWKPNRGKNSPRRWLHVVDRAVSNGGHTAMARRWMEADSGNNVHSLALPYQESLPVPELLIEAVHQAGGEVFRPEAGTSLLSRAEWLRKLAFENADCVVLHVANHSVIAPLAFGVDGGPPVLLNNHAAHVFWTGAAITDLVLNSRGSALEIEWTERLRGVPRCVTLPMPIPVEEGAGKAPFPPEFRAQARENLGIQDDEVVVLTVGREPKYNAIAGIDFIQVAHSILAACPKVRILVVGPKVDECWKRAQEVSRGRLMPIGRQLDLSPYHAAADIYIEGFPFGSTTALLEAGIHGIPCILAPAECPPPFTTDGVAVDEELRRPQSIAGYIQAVQDLVSDPAERLRRGLSLARSIRSHHSGSGWLRYLDDLVRALPEKHSIYEVRSPRAPSTEIEYFWEAFMIQVDHNDLPFLFEVALLGGVTPWIDAKVYRAYCAASSLRRREGQLQLILMMASSLLLPLCPASMRSRFYQRLTALFQPGGLMMNLLRPLHLLKDLMTGIMGRNQDHGAPGLARVPSVSPHTEL